MTDTDTAPTKPAPPAWLTPLAAIALILGIGGPALIALAGPGYQWGLWDLMAGLRTVPQYGAWAAIAGAVLGLLAGVTAFAAKTRGALLLAIPAFMIGSVAGASYYYITKSLIPSRGYPPIHEVTTDFEDPPQFVAVVPLREADGARNPPEYVAEVPFPGPSGRVVDVVGSQKTAFPDIAPLILEMPPGEAFDTALELVEGRGWTLHFADRDAGRIEATETTFWFGFKDDVAIRIRETETGGSRVDMRSKSRIGFGDIGANGERVRSFLKDSEWD